MLSKWYTLNQRINNRKGATQQEGFSLLEMAVVMVVLGLLIGGSIIPLSIQMEKRDRDATTKQLTDMREALIGFALANGRLPCPDINNDGQADGGVTCTSSQGGFPWVNLGLGKEDAWGRSFTYRVTANFADTTDGTGCLTPTLGVSFSLCSIGDMTVLDSAGGGLVTTATPAVVLSHGKNWAVTSSVDEAENSNNDSIFVDRVYSNKASPMYDDLIIWVSPNILKNKVVSAGLLP